jgi:RNA-binding motif X-linked protein 2
MNSVRAIQQLNKRELEAGITTEGSWHTDYRDTAFIYIGGLAFELSEGDIIAVFSQYGEPVWIKLARDKETGKSRGFAWLKYEDQRSCDLAVDNLGGATLLDRVLRVDHTRYKPHDDEDMRDNTYGDEWPPAGHDNAPMDGSDSDDDRPLLPEEIELDRLQDALDEDDPMRDSMIKAQQEKVDEAVRRLKRRMRKDKNKDKDKERRRHRDRDRDHDKKRIKSADDDDDHRRHRDRHSKPSSHRRSSRDRDRSHRHTSQDREKRHRHASRDEDDSKRRRRYSSDHSVSGSERRSRTKPEALPSRVRSPV